MRMLADFIMRGRWQAISVALVGSWIPFLPQAVVTMVTLRKGAQEGMLLAMVACTSAIVGFGFGQIGLTLLSAGIGMFATAYMMALVLRATMSWPLTLLINVLVSALVALVIMLVAPGLQAEFTAFIDKMMENATTENSAFAEQMELIFKDISKIKISGMIASWIGLGAVLGLLIGRWFQAMVFNPGGFQKEFHALRLNVSLAAPCLVGFVLSVLSGSEFVFWGNLLSIPLILAGLGLMHHVLAGLGWGVAAIAALYLALYLFNPLAVVVMFFGFSDAWVNYREKFKSKQ